MEVILLKNVDNLGSANTLVTVKAGYGRNYLIPQKLAIIANKSNKNALMDSIRQQEILEAAKIEDLKVLAEKLSSSVLKIGAKAGTSGKIFGSVTNVQVAQKIKETFGVELERKTIVLTEEIKVLGTYTAKVHLHKSVAADLKCEVVAE